MIDFQSLKVLMSKLKKPNNLYGCSGPGCADGGTSSLDTNRCDNINTPHFAGPQPLNVIFMSIKISWRSTTPRPRKKERKKSTFHSCCAVDTSSRHSLSDVTANHLHNTVCHRQWTQLCIVYCELLCPLSRTSQWRRGPMCTVCSLLHRPAVSTHYLHTIYTPSTLYLLSIHP